MLTLRHSFCFNGCPFISASLPLKINQKTSIIGIGWNCCKGFILLRRRSSLIVSAVEKESDFDVDPVKAREALRKLDEQLQSMAQKNLSRLKSEPRTIANIPALDICVQGSENFHCIRFEWHKR